MRGRAACGALGALRGRAACGALAALAGVLLAAAPAAAQVPQPCLGDPSAAGVERRPGPPVRWGITPAGEAGALGPRVEPVPDDPPRTLAALRRLRPPGAPFVVRLNRFFWSRGEEGIRAFLALAGRYTRAGYLVELQLRYHPAPAQEGDIPAWLAYVREVVRRFGPNRRVIAIQVTNEVNFTVSPDSSDGAYRGAREALVRGVIAAADEKRRRGFEHLEVGFNWFYRTDPGNEADFWAELRDRGGAEFVRAVEWVGLDAYPGTFFPPVQYPGGHRDGIVAAISQLRECFMPIAGLGPRVPIHVEENGWPTAPPSRSYAQQAEALELMVRAVHDFRGTYNVTDYRWFDLRDHRTSSPNLQHQYGLLRDDYEPKPAFERLRRLYAELAARPGRPRLALKVRASTGPSRGGARRCVDGPVRLTLTGADARAVLHARLAGRRDRSAPFSAIVRPRRTRAERIVRFVATAELVDARTDRRVRHVRICAAR